MVCEVLYDDDDDDGDDDDDLIRVIEDKYFPSLLSFYRLVPGVFSFSLGFRISVAYSVT